MVVAPECVARNVGPRRIIEQRPDFIPGLGKVVHAHGEHAYRTRHEFLRLAALAPMPFHVSHGTVEMFSEPFIQALPGPRQVDVADTGLLKAEFATPGEDLRLERSHIGIAVLGG